MAGSCKHGVNIVSNGQNYPLASAIEARASASYGPDHVDANSTYRLDRDKCPERPSHPYSVQAPSQLSKTLLESGRCLFALCSFSGRCWIQYQFGYVAPTTAFQPPVDPGVATMTLLGLPLAMFIDGGGGRQGSWRRHRHTFGFDDLAKSTSHSHAVSTSVYIDLPSATCVN
ncbi:hypothetical protein FB451DRAFT_1173252 [Mycena latifolia]|nr:hypothetical protein FB451DRAFT_1173252 [Mycena latifolia]